ncbi:hypothetical protein ACG7TL_006837 [Trametes sanguinea]
MAGEGKAYPGSLSGMQDGLLGMSEDVARFVVVDQPHALLVWYWHAFAS